jgi:ComF family protein
MSIIEVVVRIVAPFVCVGCGAEEDRKLCARCRESLAPIAAQCYSCGRASHGYETCADCQAQTALQGVTVSVAYEGLAKELVHCMKYERAQSVAQEIAAVMAESALDIPQNALLMPVPTATSRVRKRGYDHAALLAKRIAVARDASYAPLLRRHGQTRQVGATKLQRARQLEDAFRVVRPATVRGKYIVLIDDVLTTGSTLEHAARLLKRSGAAHVEALVFARKA